MIQTIANYSVVFLHDPDTSPTVPCAALLLILVLALSLNSLVLLSILYGPLRSRPCNAFLATVSAVAILDAVFNVTSSIVFRASLTELPHQYTGLCRANAALLQMTGMMQSFAFAALAFDRRTIHTDSLRRSGILKWAIPLSAFASIALSLPVGFGLITSTLFEHRMTCSPAYVSARPANILIATVTGVTYLATWLFTLRSSFIIIRRVLSERRRLADLDRVACDRAAERRSPIRPIPGDHLWHRIWSSAPDGLPVYILTGLLIITFLVTVVPNIVTVQITQFYLSYEQHVTNRSIRTDLLDTVFSWTRYSYNVVSPSLILIVHDELRRQCILTFCCCWSDRSGSPFVKRRRRLKALDTSLADVTTPVLFATSQGLHVRTARQEASSDPIFVIRFADLTLDDHARSDSSRRTSLEERRSRLNETFVVVPNGRSPRVSRLGETYIFPNGMVDASRSRNNTIELSLMSESSHSLLSLSQRMRSRP